MGSSKTPAQRSQVSPAFLSSQPPSLEPITTPQAVSQAQMITRHLISTSLPIQLSPPWQVDHLLLQLPHLTTELISLVTLLDRGSIAIVHHSFTSEFLFPLAFL